MKKILLSFMALAALTASAASVTPEAGRMYRVKNSCGLVANFTGTGLNLAEADDAAASQKFEFRAVEGAENTYNIVTYDDQIVASNGGWLWDFTKPATDKIAQFTIVASEGDANYINLKNVSTGKNWGADKNTAGEGIFSDKADAELHRWELVDAGVVSTLMTPVAGEYYRIRHESGNYLTSNSFKTTVEPKADNNNQIYQFIPVAGKENTYNIYRVGTGMLVGSDGTWNVQPMMYNVAMTQYVIKPSTAKEGYAVFECVAKQKDGSCLGTDNDLTKDNQVYSDKGKDAAKTYFSWWIEKADIYHAAIEGEHTNLVENGDFETEGYEQAEREGQGTTMLTNLPGWKKPSGSDWGSAVAVKDIEGNHVLWFQQYAWCDWDGDTAVAEQYIKDLTPGNEYALLFKHMAEKAVGTTGYKVIESVPSTTTIKDPNTGIETEVPTTKDVTLAEGKFSNEGSWAEADVRFTPTTEKVRIHFYYRGLKKGGEGINHYIDDVRVYNLSPADFYADYDLPKEDVRRDAYKGYKLVFAEEFSTDAESPSSDVWNFEKGYKRNNEDQYYDGSNNIYIQDGVCVIEAQYIADQKRKNPAYDPMGKNKWPASIGKYMTWTSGSMITNGGWKDGHSWKYGVFEVRAKVPQYVGCWPAIWSTGRQWSWPQGSEIDLMEYYGHCIHGNVCFGNNTWISKTVHDNVLGEGWGDEFHTWKMVWDENHLEMWCDDILVNNIDLDKTVNPIKEGAEWSGKNPLREVRQIIWLNLAMGGNSGGSLANTPRPSRFLIDYARVYQKVGTDGNATYRVEEEISEPKFNVKDGEQNPAGISDVAVDTPTGEVKAVYNLQGVKVADSLEAMGADMHGVFIVVRTDGSQKVTL